MLEDDLLKNETDPNEISARTDKKYCRFDL